MAGVVHIPWYATGFRADSLENALAGVAPAALRYGARSYSVYRSRDDRYKFLQTAEFEDKADWERYWNGPEMTEFRALTSGWYQVPVLYVWNDLVVSGALNGNGNGQAAPAAVGARDEA
jgi:quinol monooxygenase YgiN